MIEVDFDGFVDVYLKGVFFLIQILLLLLVDGGCILNVLIGLVCFSLLGYVVYVLVKGGVEVLSCYLVKEFGLCGIVVNIIVFGVIEIDFGGGGVCDLFEVNWMIVVLIVMGCVGLFDDIGVVVVVIFVFENGWMIGQCIEVLGGQNLQLECVDLVFFGQKVVQVVGVVDGQGGIVDFKLVVLFKGFQCYICGVV